VEPFLLTDVERAVRNAWALDTCSYDDVAEWSEDNRSRGQCVVTSLTLHDLFGGELLVAECFRGGVRFGWHWWNRLAGFDVDLTREQFFAHEIIGPPRVVDRPEDFGIYNDQYALLRGRVFYELGLTDDPPPAIPEHVV
jgi:hypothetical protein